MSNTPNTPAGWYDDGHGRQRWWDGTTWTDHYDAPPSQQTPARAPRRGIPIWVFVVTVVVALVLGNVTGRAGTSTSALDDEIRELRAENAQLRADDDTAEPAEETPEAAPNEPLAPITFSGQGDGNTAPQVIASGDYEVQWSTGSDCVYFADLEPLSEELFSASDATSGTNYLYGVTAGEYYVEVITGPAPGCPWSVTLVSR